MSNVPLLIDPTLSFAAQQTLILGMSAAAGEPAIAPLDGETLMIRDGGNRPLLGVPVSSALNALEDRVVSRLAETFPETGPRMLLFGPGTSRTDPLYGLRFLAKLALKTERAGTLTAYDLGTNPLIRSYFASLPWGPHQANLELGGRAGNFERLRGRGAHFILSIHPGVGSDELFESFAENLVPGGIAVFQASVLQEFADEENYGLLLELIIKHSKDRLEYLEPPSRSRLFRSFFSERSSDVHAIALRRK